MQGGVQGAARNRRLSQSLADLGRAIQESQQRQKMLSEPRNGKTEAEAYYWTSRALEAQGNLKSAADAAAKSVELAEKYDPLNWPKYQIEAAELALRQGDAITARHRATALLQSEARAGIAQDLVSRAMVVGLSTTQGLADSLKLTTDYLKRLAGDGASSLDSRMQLRLWRSEQIVNSSDPSAVKWLEMAETDADEVLRRAGELGSATSVQWRARSLLVLGTINALRYHDPEIKGGPGQRQQVGLRACRQLQEAIQLLGKDAKTVSARIAFGRMAQFLLSSSPALEAQQRRQLDADAEKLLQPVVTSTTIDKNSREYGSATELFRWFRGR